MSYNDSEKKKADKAARNTASKASWSLFIKYYDEAFRYAMAAAAKRNQQKSK